MHWQATFRVAVALAATIMCVWQPVCEQAPGFIPLTQSWSHPHPSPPFPPFLHPHLYPTGKDYRDSVLKDAKTSLIVIAGGDPDLRQAVTDGQVKQVGAWVGAWQLV